VDVQVIPRMVALQVAPVVPHRRPTSQVNLQPDAGRPHGDDSQLFERKLLTGGCGGRPGCETRLKQVADC
jgi:hypothetical protein